MLSNKADGNDPQVDRSIQHHIIFQLPPCVCLVPGIRFPLKPSERVAQSPRFSAQGTKSTRLESGSTHAHDCRFLPTADGGAMNVLQPSSHIGAFWRMQALRNETAIWGRRRGPWSMRSHLISNPSARVLKKCERAQLPDVCQHDVYICPEEWQPVAGAQQIPCRPLVALLWRSPLPSLGYDMPMQCM